MSWGRGVNNNVAGEIRMPHVAEFAKAKHRKEGKSVTSRLTVRCAEQYLPSELASTSNYAYIGEGSVAAKKLLDFLHSEKVCFVYTHDYPHLLLRVTTHPDVPDDAIVLTEVQRYNHHVCESEPYDWHVYSGHLEVAPLAQLTLEIRPRFPPAQPVQLRDAQVTSAWAKALFGLIVTTNELFLLRIDGHDIVARLIEVREEQGEDVEDDGLTMPDQFRGMVQADTKIYAIIDEVAEKTLLIPDVTLPPPESVPPDVVDVYTGDDEWFPVRKRLLRPCIALTSAIMAGKGVHQDASTEAHVRADCCTFDRVLLFLEAQAKGLSFDIEPEHLDAMADAAEELKLMGLQELCQKKRGAFESRVRKDPIPFEEVVRRNSTGEVLLTMDGMVLDVTRWLEEHPGGSVIIPQQALNMDSTVFFEIYHVSRQSFLYLKEFYIGELREEDLRRVPAGGGEPSTGFIEQLRAHYDLEVEPQGCSTFDTQVILARVLPI